MKVGEIGIGNSTGHGTGLGRRVHPWSTIEKSRRLLRGLLAWRIPIVDESAEGDEIKPYRLGTTLEERARGMTRFTPSHAGQKQKKYATGELGLTIIVLPDPQEEKVER